MSEDDPTAPITEFKQEYRFLSNFWPCRVQYAPLWYPTVEHAYQAAKCADSSDAMRIRNASSPGLAKRMGKEVELQRRARLDWHAIKLAVMADLLWQKFVLNAEFRARLAQTGERVLIEGNHHGDTFWGQTGNVGTNHLGNLLMRLRTVGRYLEESKSEHQKLHVDGAGEPDGKPDRATAG